METNTPISIELNTYKCTEQYTNSAYSHHVFKPIGLHGFIPQNVQAIRYRYTPTHQSVWFSAPNP